MSWKKVRLGDISNSIQTGPFGSQLHKSDYSVEGIPVVMPKDIVDGKLSDESIARVNESHVNRLKRHKIEVGDILYSRRGDVGRCALATKNEEGWLCGTGCLRVTINTDIANPKFIFYQLQKKEIIGWVEKHAVGATMLNLNTSILSDVPIELPNINEQNRIVEKISAYDDLIENNKKQIKLLEEAAERLYREWFVNLHFPGCEEVKIVDGVPKGWLDGTVGDIALFKRGKTITKAQIHKGIVPVVAGGLEPAYYHNVANTVAPVITISGSGANAGFARLYNAQFVKFITEVQDKNSKLVPLAEMMILRSLMDNRKEQLSELSRKVQKSLDETKKSCNELVNRRLIEIVGKEYMLTAKVYEALKSDVEYTRDKVVQYIKTKNMILE